MTAYIKNETIPTYPTKYIYVKIRELTYSIIGGKLYH